MTRFWLTLSQGADFVLDNLAKMEGGEVFVPKIPSMRITDLAEAIAPECRTEIVGIRPGEKLHEVLVPEDDARHTVEYPDRFVIFPTPTEDHPLRPVPAGGRPCVEGFSYSSDTNPEWLSVEELRAILAPDALALNS